MKKQMILEFFTKFVFTRATVILIVPIVFALIIIYGSSPVKTEKNFENVISQEEIELIDVRDRIKENSEMRVKLDNRKNEIQKKLLEIKNKKKILNAEIYEYDSEWSSIDAEFDTLDKKDKFLKIREKKIENKLGFGESLGK